MAAVRLEDLLEGAGVNVKDAKEALHKLDGHFAGEKGDIPEGAIKNWVAAFFHPDHMTRLGASIGKQWEQEHAETLKTGERAWERDPKFKSKADYLKSKEAAKK